MTVWTFSSVIFGLKNTYQIFMLLYVPILPQGGACTHSFINLAWLMHFLLACFWELGENKKPWRKPTCSESPDRNPSVGRDWKPSSCETTALPTAPHFWPFIHVIPLNLSQWYKNLIGSYELILHGVKMCSIPCYESNMHIPHRTLSRFIPKIFWLLNQNGMRQPAC